MTELFNTHHKKKYLSWRQREILDILKSNAGSYLTPHRPKNPRAARRYRIESGNGFILEPSIKRMVVDNLFSLGKLQRFEDGGLIVYTLLNQSASFVDGSVKVEIGSEADYLLSKSSYNQDLPASFIPVCQYELQQKLKIVRQQING